MNSSFDSSSRSEILTYARKLEGFTVLEAIDRIPKDLVLEAPPSYLGGSEKYRGKGGFGQFLEEVYFGKKNDSISQPDFPEAGLELKTAPLSRTIKNEIRAKERVVLGMINYLNIVHEGFESSHFLHKNTSILLVFYFHDALKDYFDLEIPLVDVWQCLEEDGKQIRADWEFIVGKVRNGLAHEISEGDTFFLGACTKGTTKLKSQVTQPYSEIVAQARAFCFKVSYVNHIYKVLLERQKKSKRIEYLHLLDNRPLTLEQQIKNKFSPYLGKPIEEICAELALLCDPSAKGFYASVARTILGIQKKHQKIYEFDAADIQIKTIRVEPNGTAKEEMSFKAMNFCELVEQEWEDSDLYQILTSKFFFVIFNHDKKEEPYRLSSIKMWNMPEKDLEIAHDVWEDTKAKIISGDFNQFVKIKDRRIVHVRTHGRDSNDLMITPQDTMQTKRSFWLNKAYLKRQLGY